MIAQLNGLREWYRRVYGFNYYNRDRWVEKMAASVPSGAFVLDVGAGPGKYRELFAHCTYKTQDFGQEPGTIGRYTKLDYECDITAIPVLDASFDVVLCTEVLEHIPEPFAAVSEMARILRPGGLLVLTAPLGSFLHQEPFHFYGGYTPQWYRTFLSRAGLSIRSIERNQGFFSLMGQEVSRACELLRLRNTGHLKPHARLGTTLVWLASVPLAWIVPPVANWLDTLGLEEMATIGYHVCAQRVAGPELLSETADLTPK